VGKIFSGEKQCVSRHLFLKEYIRTLLKYRELLRGQSKFTSVKSLVLSSTVASRNYYYPVRINEMILICGIIVDEYNEARI
jgi:hypothetical protein